MNNSLQPSDDEKERHLWMCNCPDCSSHVDTSYHQGWCGYTQWYTRIVEIMNRVG